MSICSCRLYILHGAIENIIHFLKSHNSQQFKSYYKTNRIQLSTNINNLHCFWLITRTMQISLKIDKKTHNKDEHKD